MPALHCGVWSHRESSRGGTADLKVAYSVFWTLYKGQQLPWGADIYMDRSWVPGARPLHGCSQREPLMKEEFWDIRVSIIQGAENPSTSLSLHLFSLH